MSNCKYYRQRQQVSYDNGQTWLDTGEYRKGNLYEYDSVDCREQYYAGQYFTIHAFENSVIKGQDRNNVFMSKNGGEWFVKSGQTSLSSGDILRVKGSILNGNNLFADSTGNFEAYGNTMSLIYGDNFSGQTSMGNSDFFNLFLGASGLTNTENLVLPATTLKMSCYLEMFRNCVNLVKSPKKLPATTLTQQCYAGMFNNCRKLTTMPELPASVMADSCYGGMFSWCWSLTEIPNILSAVTTLAENCFTNMFNTCKNLTTVPSDLLPITTLQPSCYWCMFTDCTSLRKAPDLPAEVLVSQCYDNMFTGCSSLIYVKCLATSNINYQDSTNYWMGEVSSSGTFVKNANATWPTGDNGIPSGWTIQNA